MSIWNNRILLLAIPGRLVSSVIHRIATLVQKIDEPGSRSAICGGTTTIIAFVSQARHHDSMLPLVDAYSARAEGISYCDYALHLILTNPTNEILKDELPLLARDRGITSVKLYMTYDPMKVSLMLCSVTFVYTLILFTTQILLLISAFVDRWIG